MIVNQGTNQAILIDTAGTVDVGVVKIDLSAAGTYGTPWTGNVGVSSGTITTLPNLPQGSITVTAGTIVGGTLTNLVSGTINSATAVINSATISVLPNLPQGSINVTAGTIATLGTMGTLGLVNTVTTVSNITNGSIVVTAGTIAAHAITAGTIVEGTLRNLISGTINSATAVLNSGTINVGTFVMPSGTLTVLPNLPQGSINVTAGTIATLGTMGTLGLVNTITTLSNLTNGSINVTAGTTVVTAGTLTAGTLKDNLAAIGTFTITVGTLASSTAGVGRQSTLIDNTTNLYAGAIVAAQITAGSVTTANQLISLYLIRSDNGGGPIADDAAGASDAAWTQQNAPLLGNILVPAVGTAVQYKAVFDTAGLGHLGPKWGIGVVQSTGNNLHTTLGSHSITYTQYNARF